MADKTNTGEQMKLFNQYLRETYTWIDSDVRNIARKAWFASVKANKELKK